MTALDVLENRIETWQPGAAGPAEEAELFLRQAEDVMLNWLVAHNQEPTHAEKEGFRLLALQRQGSKGDPSFNACRETCREVAYHYNLVKSEPESDQTRQRLEMMRRLVHHLVLFISGKLQESGLGEFCCSSRPLRQAPNQ